MNRIALIFAVSVLFFSCGERKKGTRTDTTTSGFAEFVCDDCYAPIIKNEIQVFEALNHEAFVTTHYTNEVEAVNLILKDSLRVAVLARDLSENEKESLRNKKLNPRSQKIAIDGIALIINKENTDSLISVPNLKKIMTGEITSWKELNPDSKYDDITVVFDNPNSSTVRFIKDSICRETPLYDGLKAMENNQAVLDYVAKTKNSMGVIGVNWISNPNDSTNLTFNSKVTVMSVSRYEPARRSNSFQPYPAFLALGDYPLTREMYVVLTDLRGTLQSGIMAFLASDRGQRIILKSGLVPATRPVRLISVSEHF
ncbi:phosphate ABC transporter substrate-binding protein [Dysgonomonas sp. 216]|uniref:PstS family phosphate ABC transporter substrate-binding protein n=1 Tax=Dysgonomonas sp. 216 TaxID=2302934 RepID=UPI0013D3502A|nr:substrate-binding domain-containing protein [Dysgonomonas sp. 216]NDW17950.1 phosphate ABC transporter substrate-binding protein [Dysgonomonas sp. 216]